MIRLPVGRGLSPTSFPVVGPKARPTVSILWFLVAGLLAPVSGWTAPPTPPDAAALDLGEGLTYLRLRHLPDDAVTLTAAWSKRALIVDVRYPTGETTSAISADLPARPRTAPLFVLVGPTTPGPVLAALRQAAPTLLTLGLAAPDLIPDVALSVTSEADRRAYDALDSGVPVQTLISVRDTKQRFDEAVLNREHEKGLDEPEPPAADQPAVAPSPANPGPDGAAPPAAKPPGPPEPVIDAVLQRAVQLHRALIALKRIPPG